MSAELTPLRWSGAWKDASALALLNDTPINCLVADKGALPESVAFGRDKEG
jgi:hypothetical protein